MDLRPAHQPAELFEQVSRRAVRAVWVSHAALAPGTTGDALAAWLVDRVDRDAGTTLLDLDHRPALWSDPHLARQRAAEAIACCQVVVGNQAECTMALGVDDPDRAADELLARDKVNLDITWLRDDSLEDLDNLPAPEVIAREIVEDLTAALAEFEAVAAALEGTSSEPDVD